MVLSIACLFVVPACAIVGFAGAMYESYQLTGSTTFPAEYEGLRGRTYAVIVSTDRVIEAEHPGVVGYLTGRLNRLLYENAEPSYWIPTDRLLGYLYDRPSWNAIPRDELAQDLGVERLVVLDLAEFRTIESGNPYLWNGAAEGTLRVYESDSAAPSEPVLEATFRVTFPDGDAMLKERMPEELVMTELANRLSNRSAWLFYEHDEPNAITY